MITWTLEGEVIELSLSQAPCNEIGLEMLDALEGFLAEAPLADARALIVHSTMRGGFSAGADLRQLHAGFKARAEAEHEPELRRFIERIHRVMDAFDLLPLTTIGVVHGVCFGGGFELALTCDLLIAERSARFCFPELRLGIVPAFGGIPRLRRDVGNAVIRDLLLSGRSINAKKAQSLGLVSQLVPIGDGLRAARATALQCTKFDRQAATAAKRFIKPLPAEELARERELFLELALKEPMRRALARFVESDDLRPYLP